MIQLPELVGFLLIRWKSKDQTFAEELMNRFNNATIYVLVTGLYEGAVDRIQKDDYYQSKLEVFLAARGQYNTLKEVQERWNRKLHRI